MAGRRMALREEVEAQLMQKLFERRWAPGSRLSIDGLARELAVSPTPVREALVALERAGVVDYIALRGYVVAPLLDASQIRQLLETRRLLELKAIELAFENWDDLVADLEAAQCRHAAVLERLESATDLDFDLVREHFQADWAFHKTIAEHSGNRYISSSLDGLRTHTHRMRQSFDTLGHPHLDAKEAFAEHSLVHRSIMARQKDAAIDALSSHLDGVLERYLAQVEDPQGSDHS